MNACSSCRRDVLICAALLIAICAFAIGTAASTIDPGVAEIVAIAMKPIA